jgi:hypothetical protein
MDKDLKIRLVLIYFMVHNKMWCYYCCTSLYSVLTNVVSLPQNKVLTKVMLKFIMLHLMSYFNSINLSETPITLTCFILMRKNSPDFLMHECNAHICCLSFVT